MSVPTKIAGILSMSLVRLPRKRCDHLRLISSSQKFRVLTHSPHMFAYLHCYAPSSITEFRSSLMVQLFSCMKRLIAF